MFTFSREFLDVFDGRLQDVMAEQGREFVVSAHEWVHWIRSDVRTRVAVEEILQDGERAIAELTEIVRIHVPKFVELRNQLEKLGAPADLPPPTPPGPNTPGDLGGWAMEPYSFRAFDRAVLSLQSGGLFLKPFDAVTDPLQPSSYR